ncbi:hypothetical protein WJX72_000335 [[Myrmecia] bisecta]|uniref:Uncharacterized protein n=1 Tax=[Myrmecia] bisecta TaxID=41462 RepID=A0AAW1PPK3_9CHLO
MWLVYVGGLQRQFWGSLHLPAGLCVRFWQMLDAEANLTPTLDLKTDTHKRLMYVQPYGGLGNRLRAVASALTESKSRGFDVRIVWQAHELTAFNAEWSDLFSGPELPFATWPGGSTDPMEAKCQMHDIETPAHFASIASKRSNWKMINGRPTLCVRTLRWLCSQNPRFTHWFYPLVKPSPRVAELMETFKEEVRWNTGTQWIGVHIRRTDLPLAGKRAADVLPLSTYKDIVKVLLSFPYSWDHNVRIFLATDDPAAEEDFRLSFPDKVFTYRKDWKSAHRDNLAGMLHGLADLMLLSQCKVILGTYSSSFTDAAVALGGHPYYIMVGEQLEKQEAVAPLPKIVIPIAETGGRPGADASTNTESPGKPSTGSPASTGSSLTTSGSVPGDMERAPADKPRPDSGHQPDNKQLADGPVISK